MNKSLAGRIEQFQDCRLGMFIHWGLYSLPAGVWKGRACDYVGEWIQAKFQIPCDEYAGLARQFNPVRFNAETWVQTAKAAGMKYIVYTAKHHDGFAMYGSKASSFNIVDATPFGRDPLLELASACRKYGIQLGVYYSHFLDWHEPDGGDPGSSCGKNYGMSWGNDWDFKDATAKRFENYFDRKVLPQVEEILVRYGEVFLLWFDCALTIPKTCSQRLHAMIRKLKPNCLINTRIGNGMGDFGSLGDNQLPMDSLAGAWETPATMNDTWGYKENDQNWKSPETILVTLADLASKNTNYLLNVGPKADGTFPVSAANILTHLSEWMNRNSQAVHGTRGRPLGVRSPSGTITMRPGSNEEPTRLYLCVNERNETKLTLSGLEEVIRDARYLGGAHLSVCREQNPAGGTVYSFEQIDPPPAGPVPVLEITLKTHEPAKSDSRLAPIRGNLMLPASQARDLTKKMVMERKSVTVNVDGMLPSSRSGLTDDSSTSAESHQEALEWRATLFEPGTYRVEAQFVSLQHGAHWVHGDKYRFIGSTESDVLELSGALKGVAHDSGAHVYYEKITCILGEMNILEADTFLFRMEIDRKESMGPPIFGLTAIVLACEAACPAHQKKETPWDTK